MSKSAIKFYFFPGVIVLVMIVVFLLVPLKKEKVEKKNILPSPTIVIILPTKILVPDKIIPTLIPAQSFTGADINQELPPALKEIGEQKTALRRLIPLILPFGTIEFDYENDIFLVNLINQSDQAQKEFTTWREQNYSALTQDRFAFR